MLYCFLTSSGGPVPAPIPPVSPPVPAPSTSPAPINTAPPPSNTSQSSPPTSSNPPSYTPPSPPPSVSVPSPAPSNEPASPPPPKAKHKSKPVGLIIGIAFSVFGGVAFMVFCSWKIIQVTSHPVRFFLAHAAGRDEIAKNFTQYLYKELKSTWRYKFNLIKVFFDRESLPPGHPFPDRIQQELGRTQVGVVIITEEFFERKWPMEELRSFVESKKRNQNGVRILPLFFRLSVAEVRDRLREGSWDEKWGKMSTDQHRVNVQEYREAVAALCNTTGIEYIARNNGYDLEYIEKTLKKVVKISNELRSRS
jgi:hypothetical protein